MKKTLILSLCFIFAFNVLGQTNDELSENHWSAPLFSDTIISIPKRPWLAATEVFAVNMGVWAFDRYIIDGHYAYIDLNSMKRNLQKGFYWDNDNFQTNLFNHPYHGSVYHAAARSNGMEFLESGLYVLGGSLMWELFMECELPSTNDLIATTVGGMALGETLYRLSDLVLDKRATGGSRFGREFLGFILSPGRGLTRLLTGEAWKVSPYSGKQFSQKSINFEISSGLRILELFELESELLDEGLGVCTDIKLTYGDLYEDKNANPYDYFSLYCGFAFQKNQPLIGNINLLGRLYSQKVWEKNNHELFGGVFQHFDYYDSDTLTTDGTKKSTKTPFEVGTPASVGIGALYRRQSVSGNYKVHANAHLNAIILGSSLSDYYRGNERKYNWGSGWAIKYGMDFSWKDRFWIDCQIHHNKIFTWRGYDPDWDMNHINYSTLNVQGDKSQASYNIMYSKLAYRFSKHWEIGYVRYDYFRKTNYDHFPDVSSTSSDERILLTFRF